MPAKEFNLPDIGTIYVYRRRGIKNIRLSVNSDGKVRVTMPMWLPYRTGVSFAQQKQAWLAEHLEQQGTLENNQRIGKYHTLIIQAAPVDRIQTRLKSNQIVITHPVQVDPAELQQAAKGAAQRALRKEAGQLLPQRLATLSTQAGLNYTSVSIRHLKSRWGSCNSRQEITLNYYLMQLPWELIDYVLLHELAHTEHLHHGTEFWALVERHMPNYKLRKKELRQYQPSVLTPKSIRSV